MIDARDEMNDAIEENDGGPAEGRDFLFLHLLSLFALLTTSSAQPRKVWLGTHATPPVRLDLPLALALVPRRPVRQEHAHAGLVLALGGVVEGDQPVDVALHRVAACREEKGHGAGRALARASRHALAAYGRKNEGVASALAGEHLWVG